MERLTKAGSDAAALIAGVERIFWATAGTHTFPSGIEREGYRERWLGRYLRLFPSEFFVAHDGCEPAGYLAGCRDTFGEDGQGIVASLGYYSADVVEAAQPFPAHFHVNVAPQWQGQGIGRKLVERFAMSCAEAGLPGLHAVTGSASPAGAFYLSCGFSPRLDFRSEGRPLTLYAMSL